jgi:phage tail-like protein
MMATGQRVDPYGNFNFLVEIDGITRAAFQEASGFDSSIDIMEHREGGENTTMRKLPAMTKYSNLTLTAASTFEQVSQNRPA